MVHFLLLKENPRRLLGQQNTETAKHEPTYHNGPADNNVLDTKTKTKACINTDNDRLEYPQPKHTPFTNTRTTWNEEWEKQKSY